MSDAEVIYGNIMQIAYTVEDVEASVHQFATQLGIGGWVILKNLEFAKHRHRGKPSFVRLAVGLAYQGNMMYELLQPLNDAPSVYKDSIDSNGFGFHHVATVVRDLDAEVAKYRTRGFELALEVETDNGGRGAYMDTRSVLPGMLEFLEDGPAVRQFLQLAWSQRCELDGAPRVLRL